MVLSGLRVAFIGLGINIFGDVRLFVFDDFDDIEGLVFSGV